MHPTLFEVKCSHPVSVLVLAAEQNQDSLEELSVRLGPNPKPPARVTGGMFLSARIPLISSSSCASHWGILFPIYAPNPAPITYSHGAGHKDKGMTGRGAPKKRKHGARLLVISTARVLIDRLRFCTLVLYCLNLNTLIH